MPSRALITGITGQDGSYLAELLLAKGYEVFGVVRRASAPNLWRVAHLRDRITLLPADLLDELSLIRALEQAQPHELYNLAAMSFVPSSWQQPMLTGEFNSQGVTGLGICWRLRGSDVADVAAVRGGGLRHCYRREPFCTGSGGNRVCARRTGVAALRASRSQASATRRGRHPDRRRVKSANTT